MSKFYKWTVEIAVSETWVEDGFDLTDERMHAIMANELGYATSREIRVRVTKRPDQRYVNVEQGADSDNQRHGWPEPARDATRFLVTAIDSNGQIYGIQLRNDGPNKTFGSHHHTEFSLGVGPKEYTIEVGDIVVYRQPGDRTVHCIDFDPQAYNAYDSRARSLKPRPGGVSVEE